MNQNDMNDYRTRMNEVKFPDATHDAIVAQAQRLRCENAPQHRRPAMLAFAKGASAAALLAEITFAVSAVALPLFCPPCL